jgi:hypothetical protein
MIELAGKHQKELGTMNRLKLLPSVVMLVVLIGCGGGSGAGSSGGDGGVNLQGWDVPIPHPKGVVPEAG